jgi:hypothetical protein
VAGFFSIYYIPVTCQLYIVTTQRKACTELHLKVEEIQRRITHHASDRRKSRFVVPSKF